MKKLNWALSVCKGKEDIYTENRYFSRGLMNRDMYLFFGNQLKYYKWIKN